MYEQTLAHALWLGLKDTIIMYLTYLPLFFAVALVFIFGWVAAGLAGSGLERLLRRAGLDTALERFNLSELQSRTGVPCRVSHLLGAATRWIIIFTLLLSLADAAKFAGASLFIRSLFYYLINVVEAVIIIVVGGVIADLAQKVVSVISGLIGFRHEILLRGIVKYSIWIFTLLAAVKQLDLVGKSADFWSLGFIAMIAIAGGIALGFSARDFAAAILDKISHDLRVK